jgi:glutamate N-acetyltransferase/amino-acid N-acetyltransferase
MSSLKKSPLAPKTKPQILPVRGARVAAIAAGLRYQGRKDLMCATFDEGTVCAGVFTQSKTAAAPVEWCQKTLSGGASIKALVVNAGNANAFTGTKGREACQEVAQTAAKYLGCGDDQVLLASTGVIGEPLDPLPICSGLEALTNNLSEDQWGDAADAIMTTDTFPKVASRQVSLDGVSVTITGIAKGSGMIAPDMATMLGFIVTDARITGPCLQEILTDTTQKSFNAITVDGDTSTNDTVLAFATNASDAPMIEKNSDPTYGLFKEVVQTIMSDLAHQIVKDGEGAQKFVEITVTGAEDDIAAQTIGKAIANSPLVKTAIAGEDPNWGRIVMAVGKSGEAADPDALMINIGDQLVAEKGSVHESYSEAIAAKHMQGDNIKIAVDVGVATGEATVWTCDLTHQYIDINADYRS